ncbi:MAG TPA: ribonuclease D, partial [Pyrinomonadaceae bacterium]|nr:ribonuclease D [Pyrinomonadaceae bacterium]
MEELDYRLITKTEEMAAACAELARCAEVGFDTETTSLSPFEGRVRLVQLAAPGTVYLFDLDRLAPNGDAARAEALEPLRRLLAATRPVKIGHNTKFDAKWVKHHLGVELCRDYDSRANDKVEVERAGLFDTLLASQLVSAGEQEDRHSLAVVAERYLGEAVDKSLQVSDWGSAELSPGQLEYAARDAALMLPLRAKLVEALRANALTRTAQLEFECVVPLAALELSGIYLDQDCWRAKLKEIEKQRDELYELLQNELAEESAQQSFFGPTRADINLDSHVQLTRALTRVLPASAQIPDSTRNWKLEPLAAEFQVVRNILDYRTLQKTLKFGETLLESVDKGKKEG